MTLVIDLLTEIIMLLMVQKGIPGGIGHRIHRHANANNKSMKNNHPNKELPYVKCSNEQFTRMHNGQKLAGQKYFQLG